MKYGLVGQSSAHSYAKEFQESIGDITYEIKSMEEKDYIELLKKKDFIGINVTIPYKELSIPYLDELDETVSVTGAVNTIVNRNGKLHGYNLDLFGAYANLKHNNIEVEGKTILILGTGGTSKTMEYLMKWSKASKVYKASRHPDRSETEVVQVTYEEAKRLKEVEIVINTTPVGMSPHVDDDLLIDLSAFPYLKAVVECIYNPYKTKLLIEAKKLGVKYVNGLMMMIAQGVKVNELFLDSKHDKEVYLRAFLGLIARDVNIVLIGLPGSGKKTIANELSRQLGMFAFHFDEEMEKRRGMKILDIIRGHNEAYYRELESKTIKRLSKKKGKIISCGGGIVLREENIRILEANSIIIYIDRPLKEISACLEKKESKKILEKYHTLEDMEKVRAPLYIKYSDYVIENNGSVSEAVSKIIAKLKGDEIVE